MLKVCPECSRKYPEDIDYCAQDGTRLEELRDDQSDPLIGRVLDNRWVIEQRIGMGGMGAVYLGSQRSVDRQVAIKTLKPELSHSREFVDRFFREARVASKISHPHSVTILDFGQTSDDTLYLAMEFLEGVPLTTRLREGNLSLREIIKICIQISSALAAAHAAQIIHRDLKPDNIYLLDISDESTFVKVLDFGIAKVIDAEEKMTQTGQVFGTPEYMSPEQCQGRDLDGRSDLYSLGCILYRMLVGRPPFESDTPMAVLISHVNQPPERVHGLIERPDIPESLADLCMQLLEKAPDARPDDAQAVRAQLEQILASATTGSNQTINPFSDTPAAASQAVSAGPNLGSGAQTAGAQSQPSAQIAHAPDGATISQAMDAPPNQKSALPWVLGVMIVLVLGSGCVLGGFLLFGSNSDDDSSGFLAGLLDDDEPDDEAPLDNDELDEPEPADPSDEAARAADDEKEPSDSDEDDLNDLAQGEERPDEDEKEEALAQKSDDEGSKASAADEKSGSSDKKADDDEPSTSSGSADRQDSARAAASDKPADTDKKDDRDSSAQAAEKEQPAAREAQKPAEEDKPSPKPPAPPPAAASAGKIQQVNFSVAGNDCPEALIEDDIKARQGQFLACYQDVLKSTPDAAGRLMVAWNIMTDGSVMQAEVPVTDIPAINACVLGAVKQLTFDPLGENRCYVRVTYQLSP